MHLFYPLHVHTTFARHMSTSLQHHQTNEGTLEINGTARPTRLQPPIASEPARTAIEADAEPSNNRVSKNNRHDTFSDVKLFLEREYPDRKNTIEVVCSSARRDMDRCANHVPYKLFCKTLQLFPEYNTSTTTPEPEWPTHTSIACWHDCHPFDTTPIPIPKTMRNPGNDSSNIFTVYGVFCSANCAVAYILDRNTHDQQQLIMLFKQMAINVFNLSRTEVFAFQPAPPRIFLKLFGGHLSVDDFRRSSLTSRNALLTPPFISYSMVLEENARVNQTRLTDLAHTSSLSQPPQLSSKSRANGEQRIGTPVLVSPHNPSAPNLTTGETGAENTAVDYSSTGVDTENAFKRPTFFEAAPISTHTIRGLRRPSTTTATDNRDGRAPVVQLPENGVAFTHEDVWPGPTPEKKPTDTLFDTFMKQRIYANAASERSGGNDMVVETDGRGVPRGHNAECSNSATFLNTPTGPDTRDDVDTAHRNTPDQRVENGFLLTLSDHSDTNAKLEKPKQGRPPMSSRPSTGAKPVDRRLSKPSKTRAANSGTHATPPRDRLATFKTGGTLAAFLQPS